MEPPTPPYDSSSRHRPVQGPPPVLAGGEVRGALRVTTAMGVARALLATAGPRISVQVMVDELGWDVTFQALSLLRGSDAVVAFALAWEHLLETAVDELLADVAVPGDQES